MRVRNKEIRAARHRKEQIIKAAEKVIREKYGDKKATPSAKAKPAAAPKKVAKKAE